jgi:alpha-D-ribose 1-methylphosphonate 5-triphosphate synthase subunit PhnH
MTEMDLGLAGGFADPVMQAQAAFRAIMQALANPGQPQALALPEAGHGALTPELASVLLTLADADTDLWLGPGLRGAVDGFVGFHTGARLTAEPGRADFAFAANAASLPPLAAFDPGTQDYPDRSTTIVLALPALAGGSAWTLRGPGIADRRAFAPQGLPADFFAQWRENRAQFPRGVDLLLVAEGQVMGLPRSTSMEEGH